MSGVMIKLGVYGLVRVGFDWLGAGPAVVGRRSSWRGAVSAVVGVLYALVEHDLKRLLAFSSIENVGHHPDRRSAPRCSSTPAGLAPLAALALVAALYHTVNHAAFKALLFLGAGAVAARHRHAQHGGAGRAHQADAVDRRVLPRRRGGHRRRCRR